ncbi:MAG: hypothetical protein H6945_14745 [Zoogloeaceae bacterium]|nr:hypothetical protein [Rhodocyclaceae bacterium]MCP5236991.1 hypothetical protein [Zoogloeaceae bacterium]
MNTGRHLCAALLVAVGSIAAAGTDSPAVDERSRHQQRRIDRGIVAGELTEREAMALRRGQDRIRDAVRDAKADGKLTRHERRHIERLQKQQARRISRERKDDERRF